MVEGGGLLVLRSQTANRGQAPAIAPTTAGCRLPERRRDNSACVCTPWIHKRTI